MSESENNSEESEVDKKRLTFCRIAFNIIKSRRLTLQIEQELQSGNVLGEVTLPAIQEQVAVLQKQIGVLITVRRSHNSLKQSLLHNLSDSNEANQRMQKEAVEQISRMSKMILAQMNLDDDLTRMLKLEMKYCRAMEKYQGHLGLIAEQPSTQTSDDTSRFEKAAKNIRKINTTRIIKNLLVGSFSELCCGEPGLESFRQSQREQLTIQHFQHSWQVMFTSH